MKRAFTALVALAIGLLTGGCKKPPETQQAMTEADLVAPEDLSKATWLTEEQRYQISMARSLDNPNCYGKVLRAQPDPDLAYAKCNFLERKNYHITEYRDRFAATPEARKSTCKQHINYVLGTPPKPLPPELANFSLAIKTICSLGLDEAYDN
jgi:hypothetical protein